MSWKFRSAAGRRVDVDEHVVAAGARQVDGQRQTTAGGDRRVLVDDRREVVAHDDQVDAGVRARARAEAASGSCRRASARRSAASSSRASATLVGPCQSSVYSLRRRDRRRRGRAAAPAAAGADECERDQSRAARARSLALREEVARVRRDVAADLEHDLVVPLRAASAADRRATRGRCGTPARGRRTRAAGAAASRWPQTANRSPSARGRAPVDEDRARRVERVQRVGAARRRRGARARLAAAAAAGRCPRAAAAPCGRRRSRRARRRRRARWRSASRRPCVRSATLVRSGRQHEPGFARHRRRRRRRGGHQHALSLAERSPVRSRPGHVISASRSRAGSGGALVRCAAAAGLELREQFLAAVILVGCAAAARLHVLAQLDLEAIGAGAVAADGEVLLDDRASPSDSSLSRYACMRLSACAQAPVVVLTMLRPPRCSRSSGRVRS